MFPETSRSELRLDAASAAFGNMPNGRATVFPGYSSRSDAVLHEAPDHFTNPILPPHSADPWVIFHDGFYYHCDAGAENKWIQIRRTRSIFNLANVRPVCVWHAPEKGPHSNAVWAPELHRLHGKWYIYFAADDGRNAHHRMWVLESQSDDPQGEYVLRGPVETGGWAIDGTVLQDGEALYFIWSGWPGKRNGLQNLYIAPMRDPLTLAAARTLLATPDQPWERAAMPICEGPQVLRRNGTTCVVYSASGSWTEDYCLGMLVTHTRDFLNPAAWQKVGPVLQKTDQVWGLGHCSFVSSPCGSQDWIVYHSKSSRQEGWVDRDVHAQPFSWDARGLPHFAKPVSRGVPIPTWHQTAALRSALDRASQPPHLVQAA